MRLGAGVFAALVIMGLAIPSCSFVQRIDRKCRVLRLGQGPMTCECRDLDTGKFVRCP